MEVKKSFNLLLECIRKNPIARLSSHVIYYFFLIVDRQFGLFRQFKLGMVGGSLICQALLFSPLFFRKTYT